MAQVPVERHPETAQVRAAREKYHLLTRRDDLGPAMDPASLVSALIAARIGQAQIAAAGRMLRHESAQAAQVVQLLAAANKSGEALAAAVQHGVGELVDVTA